MAALHYLALAIGLPAVYLRGRALRRLPDREAFASLFRADLAWGIAAILWLLTGPARAFGPLEKGTEFYLGSSLFWWKLALFGAIVLLEVWPMVTLMRWRRSLKAGATPDTAAARALFVVNHVELALVIAIAFVASFMARGFGAR
jgi:putative membrane protein